MQTAPLLRKKEPLLFHSRGSFCGKQFGSDEEPDQQCQPRSPQQQNEQGKVPFLSQALISLSALVLRQVASIELVVPALLGDQLIMAAPLDDTALF